MRGRELDVYLDGRWCGRITQSSEGNLTFEYDDAYRTSSAATPLSLSMPLTAALHRKRVVLPYLQGLLHDSEEALRAIARRYSVSANYPFALLEHVGVDAAGAIQLVPTGSASIDSAMSIGGEYRLGRISSAKLEQAGALFGVDRAEAADIVDATRRGI